MVTRLRHPGMTLAALAAVLLALSAIPTVAAGSVKWVIKGRGFGHGAGMSQYGAYGYALHGAGYREILRHYYRGTKIGTLSRTRIVRVLLAIDGGDARFTNASSACGRRLEPDQTYLAHRDGSSVRLRSATGKPLANCGRTLRAAGRGRVRIGALGPYRGALEVVPTRSRPDSLNVINAVPVNAYVKGVVPHEVSYLWPQAALRAQAVAARSFALTAQVDGNGFDLYSDTRSQAYVGMAGETPQTNSACAATRDEVVEFRGIIATTFYFSTSGGRTESAENVFYSDPIPYLRSVPDPYDYYSPLHTWKLVYTGAQMSTRLAPYLRGKLKRIVVTKRGDSPRIVWARLYGTGGVTKIRGDSLQFALGAYDRWMHFEKLVR